jgi:Type VI secretion system effector, Hcp
MNTVYENTTYHQLKPNRIKVEYKDDKVYPLGTFGGTIYKVRYLACCDGTHFSSALLTVRKSGGQKPVEYLKFKLETVFIAGVSVGASQSESSLGNN